MAKIITSAPNFSEGTDQEVMEACFQAVRDVSGITITMASGDPNHNRSAVDFYGSPEAVVEANIRLVKKAVELIDMNKHTGGHPRMGAVDVIPLVPLKDVTMAEAVEISKQLGQRIWEECSVPVFLYEASATAPNRENLSEIRKGQYEGMAEKIKLPEWAPDFGQAEIHPTAGVVAVGARQPMIAFNVNLDTTNLDIAKNIARIVRYSGGGFKYVKAIGVALEERNMVQVSMDITDYTKVPLYRVLELIRFEAARYNVRVAGTETLGPYPMKCLIDSALYYIQSTGFDYEQQLLENRIM